MRVFNEEKTQELNAYNLENGYLRPDKLIVKHHDEIKAVAGEFHYETVREYPNGGKDVEKVWDIPPVEAKAARDEYEDIQVYIPYTEEEKKDRLRARRAAECYPVINRGELWYARLTDEQRAELEAWYQAWLDVTDTMTVPVAPSWLK